MNVFDVDSHGNIVELDFLQVTVTKIDLHPKKKKKRLLVIVFLDIRIAIKVFTSQHFQWMKRITFK